ncbi:hypothetical protein [Zhihengliuella salsuginis]|uniref:Uncharacterized protein n=1 Tax=Zhihengliuella salsuginis TaxID=578222 RepID=A0ABQ3GIG5_9MICC|nr:hypothetical protein [Zhihengliuella salsuginis]GHD08838.1 hypothetical protein GCM10008096_20940 [Zhihengliuella salsuginis]
MYLDVDYFTPMIFIAVALVCLLAALPLVLHALGRWLRFRRGRPGYRTYAHKRSIRTEAIVGGVLIVATAALAGSGVAGLATARENFQANILRAYPEVESIEAYAWNGSWATVDVVMTSGERHTGRQATVLEDGSPRLDLPETSGGSDDGDGDG